MNSKECTKCGENKPMNAFYFVKTRNSFDSSCKECQRAAQRGRYAAKMGREVREYGRADPEGRRKERAAAWYVENGDRQRRPMRENYAAHPEGHAGRKRDCSPEVNRAKLARRRTAKKLSADERDVSTAYRRAIAADPCFYCGSKAPEMHDDHKLPLAKGGTDHWWNLARACAACNLSKGAKTAEEFLAERAV